ncbi:MAG: class III signal peptide-containing protein [Methanobacteriaceae archaeon]|jgi:hypothetical protein|nr:class III signal peptide-containing protein [Methanobacteriaceae archaeon]
MFEIFLYDEDAQGGAEMILLFGGIIVVVLIAIFFYKNYLNDFTSEIKSNEVNRFNNKVNEIINYLN